MRPRSPSGSAAATRRAPSTGGGSRAKHEVDDPLAGRPDRQRIGQLGAPGPLVGVEQVGRLDEHERDPAAGGDELRGGRRRWSTPASARIRSATSSSTASRT